MISVAAHFEHGWVITRVEASHLGVWVQQQWDAGADQLRVAGGAWLLW